MNSVLGIYSAQGGSSFGTANSVYVSIPDPLATSTAGDQCQGLGLPSLPAIYSYHCAPSSTYRNVNGTGWIPVNFTTLAAGSPIGALPQDPINTSSSRLYYTYETNGTQYEVTSVMESQKYSLGGSNDVIGPDGGVLTSVYEKGSQLGLEPLDYGDPTLVGYWPLTEGTGTVAYDDSGDNATGSWGGTQIGSSGYYSAGKIGTWAGAFDGRTDFVNAGNSSSLRISNGTISAWMKTSNAGSGYAGIVSKTNAYNMFLDNNQFGTYDYNSATWRNSGISLNDGNWHFVACSFQSGVTNGTLCYIDGILQLTTTMTVSNQVNGLGIGSGQVTPAQVFTGLIDDARISNRALSASQIAAMYAGGK